MALPFIIARGLAVKALSRAAFQRSVVGRMATQTAAMARGGGSMARLHALQGKLDGMARQAARYTAGDVGGIVARYASREAIQRTALDTLWDTLGPLGDVLRGIMGGAAGGGGSGAGGGGRGGGMEDELRAAAAFLRAFGIENVSEVLGPAAPTGAGRRAIETGERLGTGAYGPQGMSRQERAGLMAARQLLGAGADSTAVAEAVFSLGLSQVQVREILSQAGLNEAEVSEAIAGTFAGGAPPRPEAIEPAPEPVEMVRIESTNVWAVGYDKAGPTLFITYRQDGSEGPTYAYDQVPERVFVAIRDARPYSQESVGVKVWELLRAPGRRVSPASEKQQARGRRWIREGGNRWAHQYPYRLASVPGRYVPRQQTGGGLRPRTVRQGGRTMRSPLIGTGEWSGQTAKQVGGQTVRLGGIRGARTVPRVRTF